MTNRTKRLAVVMCVLLCTSLVCLGLWMSAKRELGVSHGLLKNAQDDLFVVQQNLENEIQKTIELEENLKLISNNLDKANETISHLKDSEYELAYLGDFKITYYCDERFSHICGGSGITASGKLTEVGWTAAADWDVLPNGSIVYISGIGFREIQDVGGAVNGYHIDVLVKEHVTALANGVDCEGVWLLVKKSS